jgi:hypothetical protein
MQLGPRLRVPGGSRAAVKASRTRMAPVKAAASGESERAGGKAGAKGELARAWAEDCQCTPPPPRSHAPCDSGG